jgi:SurA N-terminal domain
MDDKKQEETNSVSTDTTANETTSTQGLETDVAEVVTSVDNTDVKDSATAAETSDTDMPAHARFNLRAYVGAVVVILVIGAGLLFVLEKEGRISTGIFSGVIGKMEANAPAALVNDVKISKKEFNSSVEQLTQMAVAQGANATDPAVAAQFRSQAIETLVNAELLRQAALSEGITTSPEAIEGRFNEIRDGIGGAEQLAAKMAEFGVTEESLRHDIENEFLIQNLFNTKIATNTIEVTESEISAFYENAGGAKAGLPPLTDVKAQVDAQIRFEKEQALINAYLETLRADSEVEILI